jgi:hypothetical protein
MQHNTEASQFVLNSSGTFFLGNRTRYQWLLLFTRRSWFLPCFLALRFLIKCGSFCIAAAVHRLSRARQVQEAKNRMVSKLHDILKPFLLRRVKSDVETCLPPKREIVLYAPRTSKQLEIEKKLVNKTLIREIQEQLASKSGRSALPRTANLPLKHLDAFQRLIVSVIGHPKIHHVPFHQSCADSSFAHLCNNSNANHTCMQYVNPPAIPTMRRTEQLSHTSLRACTFYLLLHYILRTDC